MADQDPSSAQTQIIESFISRSPIAKLVQKLRDHAPNSRQLFGLLSLLLIGAVLIFLTGLTVTVAVIGLVLFSPLIIISSPLWIPLAIFLFLAAAAIFSISGFGIAVVAGSSWIYKFFRGNNQSGSYRVESVRSRVHDASSQWKGYAGEYGRYLQSKGKDAAPGA